MATSSWQEFGSRAPNLFTHTCLFFFSPVVAALAGSSAYVVKISTWNLALDSAELLFEGLEGDVKDLARRYMQVRMLCVGVCGLAWQRRVQQSKGWGYQLKGRQFVKLDGSLVVPSAKLQAILSDGASVYEPQLAYCHLHPLDDSDFWTPCKKR